MTITYIGSLALSASIPAASVAASAGISGINAALPDIQARITALASFAPTDVSFAGQIALAEAMIVSIESAIALGIPEISISAQIAIVSALIAALEAAVVSINASLQVVIDFQSNLASVGIHTYVYDGDANDFGNEFNTEFSGGLPGGSPTDNAKAILLITSSGAGWTSIEDIFKTTP